MTSVPAPGPSMTPTPAMTGALRAWAWAQSRLADYLLTREDADPAQLCCTGFSRGGKVALAAGIFDGRFSVCAPICSGAGGGGCFRYLGDREGFCQDVTKVESLGRVGSAFPHWWTKGFARWQPRPDPTQMGLEQDFPFDAHTLKALIAPRNLFTSDGIDDAWSNPRGSALTWRASLPAFEVLGAAARPASGPAGMPSMNRTGWPCWTSATGCGTGATPGVTGMPAPSEGNHAGRGALLCPVADWLALLDYCDGVWYGRDTGRDWDTCPF